MKLFLCMASALFIFINNVKAEYILFKDNEIITDENDKVLQDFCRLSPWMNWPCLNYLLREKGWEDDKENLISKLDSNEPFAVLKFFQEKFKTLTKDESYKIVWIPDTLFQSAAILSGIEKIVENDSVLYTRHEIKKSSREAIKGAFEDFCKNPNKNECEKDILSNDDTYEKCALDYKNKFWKMQNNEIFLHDKDLNRYIGNYIGVAKIFEIYTSNMFDHEPKEFIQDMKDLEEFVIEEYEKIFDKNAIKIHTILDNNDNQKGLPILSEDCLDELNKAIEIEIMSAKENNFTLFRGSSGFEVAGGHLIDSANTNIGRYKIDNFPKVKNVESKGYKIVDKFSYIHNEYFSSNTDTHPSMKSLSFGIRILDGSFYEIYNYQGKSVDGARALDFIKHTRNKEGSYYLEIPIIDYLKTPLNKQLIFIPPWDSFVGLWFQSEDHSRTKTLFDPTNRIKPSGYDGAMPFLMKKIDVSAEVLSSKIDSFIAKYAKTFYEETFYEEGDFKSIADHQKMISQFQLVSDVYSQKDNLVKSNIDNRLIRTDKIKYLDEKYIKECIGKNTGIYSVNGEKVDSLDDIYWEESLSKNKFIIINDNFVFFEKCYSELKEFATDQCDGLKQLLLNLSNNLKGKNISFERTERTNDKLLAIIGNDSFKLNNDDLIKAKELYKSEYEFELPKTNNKEKKYKKYNWICKKLKNGDLILTCQYEKLKKYSEDLDEISPYSSFKDICENGSKEEISAMFEFASNVIEEERLYAFNLSFDDSKFGSLCLLIKKM